MNRKSNLFGEHFYTPHCTPSVFKPTRKSNPERKTKNGQSGVYKGAVNRSEDNLTPPSNGFGVKGMGRVSGKEKGLQYGKGKRREGSLNTTSERGMDVTAE